MALIGLIIFIIAQLGYAGSIRMVGVNKYMAWITSMIIQTLLLYIMAMLNWLRFGLRAVVILGCILFLVRMVMAIFKIQKIPFEGFHYFDLWMIVIGLSLGTTLYSSPLLHYDNYSHWALIVKYLLLQGHLPIASDAIISFTSYPPATALFITQFVTWVGFSSGAMLVGQFLLIWAGLYAVFAVLRDYTRSTNAFILCLTISLINVFNIAIRMNNLLVDFILPVVAAAGIAGVYVYRHQPRLQCVTAFLFGSELFLIKNSGTMYVVMIGFYLLYLLMKNSKEIKWFKRFGKSLGLTALTMVGSYLSFFWWNQHVHATFSTVSKHQISTSAYKNQLASESSKVIMKIGNKFLHQIFSLDSLSTRGFLLVNLTLIIAWVVIRLYLKKPNNLLKVLLALDASFVAYYLSVFAMYIVSMPYSEAINLEGSERYLSSMVILNMLLATMALVVAMDRAMYEPDVSKRGIRSFKNIITKNTYQLSALVLALFSTILMFSEINGIKYRSIIGKEELPVELNHIAKQDMKYNHTKVLVVDPHTADVNDYYAGYVGKYYFFSDKVDGRENFMLSNSDFKKVVQRYQYVALPEWHRTFTTMLRKTYHEDYKVGLYKVTPKGLQKVNQIKN
ncbi:MAG: ABC transporter permease [Pediococcus pentosaceus]|nr:ABC transporter permease [Pediococcus pentosaceus]MCI1594753.1 ABC transporter permease [Pediococcus pentosaceus]